MSEKPQTFDEWWEAWTEQAIDLESPYSISKKAYNAGQQSMIHVSGVLTEIVTAMNNTEFFKSMPSMAPKLWNAIDRARELLGEEK